jgi:hypothetical protein
MANRPVFFMARMISHAINVKTLYRQWSVAILKLDRVISNAFLAINTEPTPDDLRILDELCSSGFKILLNNGIRQIAITVPYNVRGYIPKQL